MADSLEILYQDEWLVAVNKPAGMLVHKSEMDKYELVNAQQVLRKQLKKRIYLLHRLDKPTSGVLLFALNRDTAREMSKAIEDKQTIKTYLVVVRGYTAEEEVIDYPLTKMWDKMTDQQAVKDAPAQSAITEYKRLATVELPFQVAKHPTTRYSLIQVRPLTGRNRQIRRHMKHIFHHVVGDTTHGDGKHNVFFRQQFDCHRLLLHAVKMEFVHPVTGQSLAITAPLDASFSDVVTKLGWTTALENILPE
ncbi:pseudouridine synthase [Cytophagaceae bacterium DM2B3-1]|uniref:tRNA pseudouridine synthase C n=1 Tax=Xanthocytophaga flava TaxID=3048013 RepID=A0ABT7CVM8_9BACT|nr:pseudouridine synthase [Xanthocytophaga flavus]MDJ1469172.1 pseudouridine synthase [Xanthocytophaga flavus]MDJ1497571.1 pseudouridine synthase [Xanthocytophaga flavus]